MTPPKTRWLKCIGCGLDMIVPFNCVRVLCYECKLERQRERNHHKARMNNPHEPRHQNLKDGWRIIRDPLGLWGYHSCLPKDDLDELAKANKLSEGEEWQGGERRVRVVVVRGRMCLKEL